MIHNILIHSSIGHTDVHWWLGATNQGTEPYYLWMGNRNPMIYFDWNTAAGEPNNAGGRENCVQLQSINISGKWNDSRCSNKNFVICESEGDLSSFFSIFESEFM